MFFKKKKDTVHGRVDFLDAKPFPYLNDQLEYAKERYVINTEGIIIRCRIYHDYLFKVVLISDFDKFDLAKCTNKYLKDNNLLTDEEKDLTKSMNIFVIEENTERTRIFAKEHTILTKNGYQQFLVYNDKEVVLEYFNELPLYDFNLMKYYRTMVFFDLACHDKEDY